MIRVAVAGASGYTGVELIRILSNHSDVDITAVTSEQSAGKHISDIFPSLKKRCDLKLLPLDPDLIKGKADLVFTALPHEEAMKVVPLFLSAGLKVIDLSADYRIHDPAEYGKWYSKHTDPANLDKAVYGLPEIRRDEIRDARIVANPGCYPTSIILALKPLLDNNLIDIDSIIADSKSGTTGAGRSAKVDNLYCEVNDNFKAYSVGGVHRHIPEIEQELSILAKQSLKITFTPHLVPMDRGIVSTVYAKPVSNINIEKLRVLYQDSYNEEPFVRVLPKGVYPCAKAVRGSNFCDITVAFDERTSKIIVVSAIDNLVKGASGQAVQNFNIMTGNPETRGLEYIPLYP